MRVSAGMKASRLGQSELARRVGTSATAISMIVNGKTQQSRFLPAIATVLGVSINYLLGETDEMFPAGLAGTLSAEESAHLLQVRLLSPSEREMILRIVQLLARNSAVDDPEPAR